MIVKDVVSWFDKYGPRGPEEILLFGDLRQEVTGIAVCWMPTLEVMEKAAAEGCNMIICHESLTFPFNFYIFGKHLEQTLSWRVNKERLSLLSRNNMSVLRIHATMDREYIIKAFVEALGLKPFEYAKPASTTMEIEETSLKELALDVKRRVGVDTIRVTGTLDTRIRKIGVAVGGIGLSVNMSYLQRLVDDGVDVIITGEADEESLRFAEDSGVCFIETSHIACESIGLAKFAQDFQREFPGIKVKMLYARTPWRYM